MIQRQSQESHILKIEDEVCRLQKKLKGATLSDSTRQELHTKVEAIDEQFKAVLAGRDCVEHLEKTLVDCDILLTQAIEREAHQLSYRRNTWG